VGTSGCSTMQLSPALGCDMVNVAREAMLSIGCIQAQRCHTDTCPTGVATQNAWLSHGLDPQLKSVRLANYVKTLRRDLVKVAKASGVEHPGLIDADSVEGPRRRPIHGRTGTSTQQRRPNGDAKDSAKAVFLASLRDHLSAEDHQT
jgi:Conserved region in glutamate synthase